MLDDELGCVVRAHLNIEYLLDQLLSLYFPNIAALGALHLDAGSAIVSHLLVHMPDEYSKRLHQVSVRQTYRGKEIGRITWLLVPPPQ